MKPEEIAREAWAAAARRDTEGALQLWQRLREAAPERHEGHIWPISVLWQAGRFDEAEAMAAAAAARLPGHAELLIQRAWIATARERWEAAAERWAAARARAPDRVEPFAQGALALWKMHRLDAAAALAREGRARFPEELGMLTASAWIATAREDWSEALGRWNDVLDIRPGQRDVQVRIAEALRGLGRIDDSESMAAAVLSDYPDDTGFLIEQIWTAIARRDWVAAVERLETAGRLAEHPERVAATFGSIEKRIRFDTAARSEVPSIEALPPPEETDAALGRLMLRFESIGERCDFGAVQRHFGVEPLGLFRFAWTKFDALVAALDDRFEAIGTDEDTSFRRWEAETIVYMRKYQLIFHTLVNDVDEMPEEQRAAFHQQQRRRLSFLKDKLIRDLEEPRKILVYATNDYAADEHVSRLFAAVRAYGPNTLLYVRPERTDRPVGTIERLEDGLFAGYFTGLTDFVGGSHPPYQLWLQLCLRTYQAVEGDAADQDLLRHLV